MLRLLKNSLLFVFLGLSSLSYSSDRNLYVLDSLMNRLEKTKDYFEKTELYFELGQYYYRRNVDSSIYFFEKAYQAAELTANLPIKVQSGLRLGYSHQYRDPVVAIKYTIETVDLAEELNDSVILCDAYGLLGLVYREQMELDQSMNAYQKSLTIAEKIGDSLEIAQAFNGIGIVSMMTSKYEIGLEYWKKSLEMKLQVNDSLSAASTMANIGLYYKDIGRFEDAEEYLREALSINKFYKDFESIAFNYKILGGLYLKKEDYHQSLKYYQSSLDYIDSTKGHFNKEEPLHKMSIIHAQLGNHQKAYELQKEFIELLKEDYDETNNKIKKELAAKYESEKKEKELELLNSQNKAKDAKIKAQIAENALAQERMMYLTVGLTISVLLIIMTLYFFQRSQKSKKIIEQQKTLVEQKNNEITDSINYAKRLQDAILPPIEEVKKHFSESFVLFKPKDIVSGDFYWMETTKTHTFLAAADCTGHGVPGAMVSVVCANALNKAVNEKGKTEPAEILDTTRDIVIETFAKAGNEVKDGMDISLLSVAHKSRMRPESENEEENDSLNSRSDSYSVSWSGANNPLWIIRTCAERNRSKNTKEIEEIKADKQPIGLYGELKAFTNHKINVNKGDRLYMFSDGFADQFGGERGKKMKSGRFKKILLNLSHEKLEQQSKMLNDKFENWKGVHEQLDDVCVIGVQL